jgi:hypothetical protein
VDAEGHLGLQELSLGLVDVLEEDRDEGRVPVVGDKDAVLAGAKGEGADGLDGGLVEEGKALVVVDEVSAGLGAVELGAGLAPDLGKEPGVVDKNTVDALLDRVEEADGLSVDVDGDRGVPAVSVLVIAGGNGDDVVATLGELDGESSNNVSQASSLGPGGDLGSDEDDVLRGEAKIE